MIERALQNLPPLPDSGQSAITARPEIKPLPSTIEIDESSYTIFIDGKTMQFKGPTDQWKIFMFICQNPDSDLNNAKLQQHLGHPERGISLSQTMGTIKAKFEREGLDIGNFAENKTTQSYMGVVYRLAANVVFKEPQKITTQDKKPDEDIRPPKINIHDEVREMKEKRAKKRIIEDPQLIKRTTEINRQRQNDVKTDLAMIVLSNIAIETYSLSNPDKISRDLEALLLTVISSKSFERSTSENKETMLSITECKSPDELKHWFIGGLGEMIDTYWNSQERVSPDTRGAKIINFCRILQAMNVNKKEIIVEVCRHFGIEIPDEYKGTDLNPKVSLTNRKHNG